MITRPLILLEFSIVRGGLFYRLQERLRVVTENNSRIVARATVFALVSFCPLVILAAVQGFAINADTNRSMLLDFSVYGRFVVAIPLFVLAEGLVHERFVIIASYFFNSGIIPEGERAAYLNLLNLTQRLVTAAPAEIFLVLLAYLVASISVSYDLFYGPISWKQSEDGTLSFAGWWLLFVSMPLFQFLLLRWAWRLIIWCIFLWRLSRLDLQLLSTHPDSAGGLGILAESIYAFTPIFAGLSAVFSSVWCKAVVFFGADANGFIRPFCVFLLATFLISVAPLTIFTERLIRVKLRGLHDYGVLANAHSWFFDEKWIRHAEQNMPSVLGTPDISSLCDLSTDYQTVQSMKLFPFRLQNLLYLAGAVCIPMIPLLLIQVPLREVIVKVAGALL